ncbi:SDR family NAD(P)-dependent oxidoreductase [Streptomyces sp. NPDC060002]|uniref:SDR family NAD(P)-dependent oxidoreductase n=1 Tax=Streptomyces sp. NPDC060002 TaxID=3347033 RepID=UPI0036A81000
MKILKGRVAVVTGGASGIGLALATRFLSEGMRVVVADIDDGALERAEISLAQLGEVLSVHTNVASAASVEALRDTAVDRFGAVHVLCNNAGVGGLQRFAHTTLRTWEWTLGVNLHGVVFGCSTFLPVLAAQEEAHIVNTASMAGFLTSPYLGPYCASKAAVVALSESMAAEFATEFPHIGVSVLCPAYTATNIRYDERNAPTGHMIRSHTDPDLDELRQESYRNLEAGISAVEVADLVVRGMAERRTHLFPQPLWVGCFEQRAAGIAAHLGRASRDRRPGRPPAGSDPTTADKAPAQAVAVPSSTA